MVNQKEMYIQEIIRLLEQCDDFDLLELILLILIKSV